MIIRIEHRKSKTGVFATSSFSFWWEASNSDDMKLAFSNFSRMPGMLQEIPDSIVEVSDYKCAFKSAGDLFMYVPFNALSILHERGFRVVTVKGKVVTAKHQIFFRDSDVVKKEIPLNKVEEVFAYETFCKDLEEEGMRPIPEKLAFEL